MKLSAQTIASVDNLLTTLNTIGIEKVIVEPGKIRAIDEKRTVGVVTDQQVPDLEGKTLAVSRIKALKDRLNLAKAQGNVGITATAGSGTDISMLELAAGRSKTQFRCSASDAVKIPKAINDTPAYEVLISVKQIPLIAQADSAMATDGITIASKDGSVVSIELVDSTKDVYTFEVEKAASPVNGQKAGSFVFKYTSKSLLSLLREAAKTAGDDVKLKIGSGGMLFVDVAGYNFFTLPQA
jgi:hypothetical protein